MRYIELHRRYELDVAIGTAFEWDAPGDRKARQKLERELILKWRERSAAASSSPFNKECWKWWGQPFGKI